MPFLPVRGEQHCTERCQQFCDPKQVAGAAGSFALASLVANMDGKAQEQIHSATCAIDCIMGPAEIAPDKYMCQAVIRLAILNDKGEELASGFTEPAGEPQA